MMRVAKLTLCLAVALAWVNPLFAANESIYFDVYEIPFEPLVPPKGLIPFILKNEPGDHEGFSECLSQHNISNTEPEKLFTVVEFFLNEDSYPDYFIRPILKPYCGVFYGAHLFRYWLVTSSEVNGIMTYTMAYRDGTDSIVILASESNKYRDLLIMNFMAGGQYYDKLQFNGEEYVVTKSTFEKYGE